MIDFDNFTEKGLKKVLDKLKQKGLPVDSVSADNRSKRMSGFLTKSATITFESGQKLFIGVKADGGVFQVKLNGMVIPVKNYLNETQAFNDLAARIKRNEAVYLKARAKRLAKAADNAVKTQQTKQKRKPSLSLARQIEEKTAQMTVQQEEVDGLKASVAKERGRIAKREEHTIQSKPGLETIRKKKTELEGLRDSLKRELKGLKQ